MDENAGRAKLADLIRNRIDEDTFEGKYNASIRKKVLLIISLIAISIVTLFAGICLGSVDIPPIDIIRAFFHPVFPDWVAEPSQSYYSDFIFKGRIPRVLLVALTGFSLGVAGMVMQGLLRNPLVSPFTLGLSTAASFGAALAILFGPVLFGALYTFTVDLGGNVTFYGDDVVTILFAFAMSTISIGIVLMLARGRDVTRSTVILSGVVISYLFQAGVMATKYFSDDDQLREITLWIMGSFSGSTWGEVMALIPIVVACCIYLIKLSLDINALSAGDDVATNLGIDVPKLRRNGLIVCTLMTASCLAFTGVIGFVGLMAPHLCRMLIGNDSRYLLPSAGLMGIAILAVSDLFCRLIIRPGELPVGIVLYVIGGAFFIWMIGNKKWRARV